MVTLVDENLCNAGEKPEPQKACAGDDESDEEASKPQVSISLEYFVLC